MSDLVNLNDVIEPQLLQNNLMFPAKAENKVYYFSIDILFYRILFVQIINQSSINDSPFRLVVSTLLI